MQGAKRQFYFNLVLFNFRDQIVFLLLVHWNLFLILLAN